MVGQTDTQMDGQTDAQSNRIFWAFYFSLKKKLNWDQDIWYSVGSEIEEVQSDVNYVQKLKFVNDWRIWNIENDKNVIFVKNDNEIYKFKRTIADLWF